MEMVRPPPAFGTGSYKSTGLAADSVWANNGGMGGGFGIQKSGFIIQKGEGTG